jgi:hypothetical protein
MNIDVDRRHHMYTLLMHHACVIMLIKNLCCFFDSYYLLINYFVLCCYDLFRGHVTTIAYMRGGVTVIMLLKNCYLLVASNIKWSIVKVGIVVIVSNNIITDNNEIVRGVVVVKIDMTVVEEILAAIDYFNQVIIIVDKIINNILYDVEVEIKMMN